MTQIPVVLFAYARVDHLEQTLAGLRENAVPLIYAFSDGARTPDQQPAVDQVRRILREIDWCEVVLTERNENWGLGRSILSGVTEVFKKHDALIVFEDDLICVPGTYRYLCAALEHYRDDPRVMSVTGWTHPRAIPSNVTDQPYFDGRAECWTWGTWRRSWVGMDKTALTLMHEACERGVAPDHYGADLPYMAKRELALNIWAVRLLYLHMAKGGLCLRPPHSMVEHIGYDAQATNTHASDGWENPPLQTCPPIPAIWTPALENPQCAPLWQQAYRGFRESTMFIKRMSRAPQKARRILKTMLS